MYQQKYCLFFCGLLLILALTGCNTNTKAPIANSSSASTAATQSSTSLWDNTPKVLVPTADGSSTSINDSIHIDKSNSGEGYIMVQYMGSADKIKFFVITPSQVRYTYDLQKSGDFMALPLTGGSGTYTLDVREHVKDDLYSNLLQETVEVTLNNEYRPFLYPNQYTWFTTDTKAVLKASELTESSACGLDAIASIYNYIINNVSYDDAKAENVESGYLPDVDETLSSGKGICFDYAALMTAMLRSQGIPTKLEIGYSGEVYHAWISTYLKETGWVDNVIQFDGKKWSLMDPTLASSNNSSDVKKYVGDGTNYTVKYSR